MNDIQTSLIRYIRDLHPQTVLLTDDEIWNESMRGMFTKEAHAFLSGYEAGMLVGASEIKSLTEKIGKK